MVEKINVSVPYMYDDEQMQEHFKNHFYRRPIAKGRSLYLENFTTLLNVHGIFEYQGWGSFLRIFEEIYAGVAPAFYNTLNASDEDNTSLRSIIRSFELQVLPSDIVEITKTQNEGIHYHGGDRWWEELGVLKAEVAKALTGNRGMRVRDTHTSSLLVHIRAIFSVVQHTVLLRSGNTDVMSKVDHMVMFCLMTKTKINLVRLILYFIIAAIGAKKKKHASLPYSMFLTIVFNKAQFPLVGEKSNNKRPTTTMKTFPALGLKPQALEKEKETRKNKKVATKAVVPSTKKSKTKPYDEGKK